MNTTGHYYDVTLDRWVETPAAAIDYTPPPNQPEAERELDERYQRIHKARTAYYDKTPDREEEPETVTPDQLERIADTLERIATQLERIADTTTHGPAAGA